MKPKRSGYLNKPRFAVDFNTAFNPLRSNFGGFSTFTSVFKFTKDRSVSDEKIVEICNKENYHIITHNTRDFENLPIKFNNLKIGLICINLQEENYLSKFGSLLRKYPKHENYNNKLIYIGNEIKIINYSKLRIRTP